MPRNAHFQPGRYWARITDQQLGYNNKGNKQLVLRFELIGRINPSDPEGELLPCDQFERTIFRVINENTLVYVLDDLEILGFDGESWAQLDLSHAEACDLRGQELAVSCTHEQYAGNAVERWGISREPTRPEIKPLEPKAQRELDNLFGRELKAHSKAVRERKSQTEQAEPVAKAQPPQVITPEEVAAEVANSLPDEEIPF